MSGASGVVLDVWHHAGPDDHGTLVLPDGCRDLIVRQRPGARPAWSVSALFDTAGLVPGAPGARFSGLRFHPAAVIDVDGLLVAARALDDADVRALLPRIDDFVTLDLRLADALAGLSVAASVSQAARRLGVSERTLERHARAGTGRAPAYWKNLARVRRAARALVEADSIAGVAAEHGFADQAHMTRQFRTWFGLPPGRLARRPDLLGQLAAPAYDSPAGVQISTSTPFGSTT
ncbi:MAG: helix-turn-helix domain-containing protein [Vicinamibacterales bacterium]